MRLLDAPAEDRLSLAQVRAKVTTNSSSSARGGPLAPAAERRYARSNEVIAEYELLERPFNDDFLSDLTRLACDVFGDVDALDLAWRLSSMPDAASCRAQGIARALLERQRALAPDDSAHGGVPQTTTPLR
jgi:hypothetical protein